MIKDQKILIGKSNGQDVIIYPKMANRHGLIAGATGTGKTVTLKVMAESFSELGVPVFLADIKGDLAATAITGEMNENVAGRVEKLQLEGFETTSYPVTFWDIYGQKGIPLRASVSEMGPLLMAQVLGLNDTQTDLLSVIFKIADDEGLLLIDTKDLKAMLQHVYESASEYSVEYGNIAKASLTTITRSIVALEGQGGEQFFGEPAVDVREWLQVNMEGKGKIQILDCQTLINNPKMYGAFMLWLMSELFEVLPEAGDPVKPKMVFFFDEAHLLFDGASKELLSRVEQVVKLIRSKGVGIYFITQSPSDIPDGVLAQLGNKVQHALRAYTPKEQKATKAAAQSYRANPEFDTYETLLTLGVGEAIVSTLDETGIPTIVQKTKICPPQSMMGSIDDLRRMQIINMDPASEKYAEMVDRESAYEILTAEILKAKQAKEEAEAKKQAEKEAAEAAKAQAKAEREAAAAKKQAEREAAALAKQQAKEEAARKKEEEAKKKNSTSAIVGKSVKSAGRSAVGNTANKAVQQTLKKAGLSGSAAKYAGQIAGNIARGIFGNLIK